MQKLLITGQMRSGTTFMANFLNSQNNMTVYADFLISLFVSGQRLQVDDINTALADRNKNILIAGLKAEANAMNVEGFDNITKNDFNTWNDLFDLGLRKVVEFDENTETKVVGIKKTIEQYFIGQLLENDHKIIYMYRDPRDVLLSAKNRFSDFSLYTSITRWAKSMDHIEEFVKNKNMVLVKYEDLILNKEDVSSKISDLLGVEINTNLSTFKLRKGSIYKDNSSFHDVSELFDEKALYRWKNDKDSDEVILASCLLKDQIAKYDYEAYSPEKGRSKPILKAYHKKMRNDAIKRGVKKVLRIKS